MTSSPEALTPFPQQRAAIEAPLGPTLVLAGPGAGKTFCLIRRVEYLIEEKGFAPERICAVTFTNKAAEEVTARLHRRLGDRADRVTRGTLHALCLGILREHPEPVGLRRGFGVADEQYQRLILRRLGVRPAKRHGPLLTLFGRNRLQGYRLTEGDDALLDSYLSMLRQKNLVDFDDIIALTDRLFRDHPPIAEAVAARWGYLLVDEAQDLDAAQYRILKRLVQEHRNIFAVGDDEQSIFSWRGSDPRILWQYRTDFEVEDPIILDRNCRCSRQIFEVARRLMRENPELFVKKIEAERESEFKVECYNFDDETAEADWLLESIVADRESSGCGWGDYAVLYRKHQIGRELEKRFVAAGVPCRLARGRALLDDPVIAYVVASLRVMTTPDEPLALEAFAERLLPRELMAEVRTIAAGRGGDLLGAMRAYARRHPKGHPDSKKAWRFVYHVENLRAVYESHSTLTGLIDELLSQRIKRYENRLEERHDELEDPEVVPAARQLADRLTAVVANGGSVYLAPLGGIEVAARGMLQAVELPAACEYLTTAVEPRPGDLVLGTDSQTGRPLATTLFKALQLIQARSFRDVLQDYVTFDIETTDLDPGSCEIIELGAAKVSGGVVVDTFRSFVSCHKPISLKATEKHGYTQQDLQGAPSLEEVWPRFFEFVDGHVMVAHNGHGFDVPVLRRNVERFANVDDMIFYDTLPLARSLFHESARLEDLATRFHIDAGVAHHALDDAVTLAHVFQVLGQHKRARARKAALINLLDHLAIGLALEPPGRLQAEDQLLLELAVSFALGRYSDCLEFYGGERDRTPGPAPDLEELIARLGGRQLMEKIRTERRPAERYPAAVARLRTLIEASRAEELGESVRRLLERVALSTSEGVEADPHRVNLLTLHSTKGLEFSRVYLVGVEDMQIPGYYAVVDNRRDEIDESRRLLYVGMTRAKDRLVLTRTVRRHGRESGGSLFLDEMALTPTISGSP